MKAWLRILPVLALASLAGCADSRRDERLAAAGPNPTLEDLLRVADAESGARQFAVCASCHSTSKGAPDMGGPNLHGVFGKPFARNSDRFSYTDALRTAGGIWDATTLDAWIARPKAVVLDTKMGFSGMADPLSRADIIAYLQSLSD